MKNFKKLLTTVILSATLASNVMVAEQEGRILSPEQTKTLIETSVVPTNAAAGLAAEIVAEQTGNVGMPSTSTTVVDAVAKPSFWDKLKVNFSNGKAKLQNSKLGKVVADNPRATAVGAGAVAAVGAGYIVYRYGLLGKAWSTVKNKYNSVKNFVKKHPYGTAAGTAITAAGIGTLGYFANKGSLGPDAQGFVRNARDTIVSGVKGGWNLTTNHVNPKVALGLAGTGAVGAGFIGKAVTVKKKALEGQVKAIANALVNQVEKVINTADGRNMSRNAARKVVPKFNFGDSKGIVDKVKQELRKRQQANSYTPTINAILEVLS